MPNIRLPCFGSGVGLAALGAIAQFAAAAEAPSEAVAEPPEAAAEIEARFEDWRLVCPKACHIEVAVRGEAGAGREVLRLRVEGPEPARVLVVETPLPLYLPDGLNVAVGGAEPRATVWRTCGPEGCEARLMLEPALLAAMRGGRAATLAFTVADGGRVRLPASLMGFTAAEQALARETPRAR